MNNFQDSSLQTNPSGRDESFMSSIRECFGGTLCPEPFRLVVFVLFMKGGRHVCSTSMQQESCLSAPRPGVTSANAHITHVSPQQLLDKTCAESKFRNDDRMSRIVYCMCAVTQVASGHY